MDGEQQAPREAAMRRAGAALARRARSEAELARSLTSVAPPGVVSGVLGDLRALGYLDDTALACALADRRLEAGWGSLRVQADLDRLEVTDDATRAGIGRAEAGERAAAELLLASRRLRDDPRRAAALLARRGFCEDTAEALLPLDIE